MMTAVRVLLLATLLGVASAAAPFGDPAAGTCGVANRPQLAYPGPYGTDATAKACFATASRLLKANVNGDNVGPCLRAGFHDCGTYRQSAPATTYNRAGNCGGCNGSFKQEFEAGTADGFASFPEQNGMQNCYNLLWGNVKAGGNGGLFAQVKASCPQFTKADFISLAGYYAVINTGGAPAGGCSWYPGRLDDANYDNTDFLPPESMNAPQLHNWFDQYEMADAEAFFNLGHDETVATLSGAHTIGKSRVHGVNPTSRGINALSGTPNAFDGGYYAEVIAVNGLKGQFGWFASDMHGFCNNFQLKGAKVAGRKLLQDGSGRQLLQSAAAGNDIAGVPAPTPPNQGTPGGVAGADLTKEVCTGVVPNQQGDSIFAQFYLLYGNNFNAGDDSLFKSKFCQAYQTMSTIGYQFPVDYNTVASQFILS